jgi:hypothetical protein
MTEHMRGLFEKLVSAVLLLTVARKFKSRSSLMKIRAAKAYVLVIKKIRLFCLGILFVTISFILLMNGITLVQAAIFTYSTWSNEAKFISGLLLGGIEFLTAVGILIYLFREETWSKFSGIPQVVNLVINEERQ